MSNPNNLVRPSILNSVANNGANAVDGNQNQNAQIELVNLINRIALEVVNARAPVIVHSTLNPNEGAQCATDQTISEEHAKNLTGLDKIPDVVKCLREFSGNPEEFNSWRKSIERILLVYESCKGTSKYYGILSVIRNKIVGSADAVLESYNTPLDWGAINKCLTLHYADKRDVSTLEYEMTSLVQGNKTVEEFYKAVYVNLSLILNKIGCMQVGNEALNLLTHTYRNKALDTFVRGLNGDMPRLLGIKEPVDLPQALHLCLKLENQGYRTRYAHNSQNSFNHRGIQQSNSSQLPQRNFYKQPSWQYFHPQVAYLPQSQQPFENPYRNPFRNPPMRPQEPKPQPRPEPMEVDGSLQSRRINYMNQPQHNRFSNKRPIHSDQNVRPQKTQRNFHIAEAQRKSENSNGDETSQVYEYGDVHFLD